MNKTCGNCRHFEPKRNPATGRALPSEPGKCGYPVPWPAVLPKCYPRFWHPTPAVVLVSDNARQCACWEAKKRQGDILGGEV